MTAVHVPIVVIEDNTVSNYLHATTKNPSQTKDTNHA